MKIRHYSKREIYRLFHIEHLEEVQLYHYAKPQGFWISVEDDLEQGWNAWCKSENYCVDHLKYEHEVQLKPDCNILYCITEQQVFDLSRQFPFKSKYYNEIKYVDWIKVKEKYQGIIIAPYQWQCRWALETSWYYGWDCASGCIWDLNAVESIKLINITEAVNVKSDTVFDEEEKIFNT